MNNIRLSSNQVLQITNMLRLLGLKNSHIGTKLINKSIQYVKSIILIWKLLRIILVILF